MAVVTANVRINGNPVRNAFVEHTGPGGLGSFGWDLTDGNGSFTFDAGAFADKVDIKIHCQNSVVRVLDGGLPVPVPVHQLRGGVANGATIEIPQQRDYFRILDQCLDVYDTVWKHFRPYNHTSRKVFALGRSSSLRNTFASSKRIELSYPDSSPATLAFVEPAGLNNSNFPLVHIKSRSSDGRLFGDGDAISADHDPSLLPHELGHVFHFSAQSSATRQSIEGQYIAFILSNLSDPTHSVSRTTTPFVAFIEAVGIFSSRFFFFSRRVEPTLSGQSLRRAFFRDELVDQRLSDVLVDPYFDVGKRNASGTIQPELQGADVEGAVYGAIYVDFASRVGLREAVGLVMDSNATSFEEFKQHVEGRGNQVWRSAIRAAATTWGM